MDSRATTLEIVTAHKRPDHGNHMLQRDAPHHGTNDTHTHASDVMHVYAHEDSHMLPQHAHLDNYDTQTHESDMIVVTHATT